MTQKKIIKAFEKSYLLRRERPNSEFMKKNGVKSA